MGEYAKLIDISKCVGCRACEVACKEWNETGSDNIVERPFGYQSHEDLTYRTWNIVKFYELGSNAASHSAAFHSDGAQKKAINQQFNALLGPEPIDLPRAHQVHQVHQDDQTDQGDEKAVNYSVWNVMKFFQQDSALNTVERAALPKWMFRKHGCMHCKEAACVKACPVDALARNDELGYVRLDVDACTGCGYCVDACPFDVPQLAPGAVMGFGKVSKCRLCSDRIQHDLPPACVQSCPPNALEFGARDEMIELGRRRVADLRSRGYQDANLYGEHELGGLNVLTVLPSQPQDFDLPADPQLPDYLKTWKEVVQPLGALAIAGTALALGFGFINSLLRGGNSHKGSKTHGKTDQATGR